MLPVTSKHIPETKSWTPQLTKSVKVVLRDICTSRNVNSCSKMIEATVDTVTAVHPKLPARADSFESYLKGNTEDDSDHIMSSITGPLTMDEMDDVIVSPWCSTGYDSNTSARNKKCEYNMRSICTDTTFIAASVLVIYNNLLITYM